MAQSLRFAAAAALGAFVVAVAALTVSPQPASGAATLTDPAPHTITVTGTATATVVPDVARVSFGVNVTKTTVKAARATAAQQMTAILEAIKGLGIADQDIQTTGLNLWPQYARNSTKVTGYTLSQQIQVTVRDLDRASDVVDTAMAKGATEMSGITFDTADPAKALNDARIAAIAAARTSAEVMATAAKVSLGSVISVSDASPAPIIYPYQRMAAMDAATPIQPGSQDISATVSVVFEIE
jgi:uncharacterized protein YggE